MRERRVRICGDPHLHAHGGSDGTANIRVLRFGAYIVPEKADRRLAANEAGLPTNCVAAAYDGLTVPLWQPDRNKPLLPEEAFAMPSAEHADAAAPVPLAPMA